MVGAGGIYNLNSQCFGDWIDIKLSKNCDFSIGLYYLTIVKILTLYHFAAAKVPLRTVCVEHFCSSIKNKVNWHLNHVLFLVMA